MQQVKGIGPVAATTVRILAPESSTVGDKAIDAPVGSPPPTSGKAVPTTGRATCAAHTTPSSTCSRWPPCAPALTTPFPRRFHQRLKDKGRHGFVYLVALMRTLSCLLNQSCSP